ncbi:C40 family peptidase [Streptomyces sp. NA02950]|uniref:C40 family peptidase n=1 Tax=Streptomyces sp. NA02950 TaxID=2742137 RepID=UPI00159204C0|nr:C40 family peptidase [Streptomyces sp. NA02950]QKV95424.1 C40 family peptidase [Streptomyces sp. NA02950]
MASCRRVPKPGPGRATVWTAAAAAAASAAALGAGSAGAEPRDPADGHLTARLLSDRIERLYVQAERATERYNAAETRTEGLRRQVDRIQDRVARAQERVNRMRVALGAFAGGQYRSGGLDPGLALLLSEEPAAYLDKATTLERIGHRQSAQLRVLQGARRTLSQQRAAAAARLVRLEYSRKAVARHKRDVQRKLAIARRLVNILPPGEREAYDRASRHGRDAYGVPGALAGSLPPSSPRAATAFGAARAALGLPYAWGQAGPTAFDCSGLTQWAYARAGVAIPRTSQAQSGAGQRVPLSQARPGDLVVYRADGSHVAMYAGNGQVIHAPHPGARVRYDPVGMMPISSVTRV